MFELIPVEKEKQNKNSIDEKLKFLDIEDLDEVQYDIYNSYFIFPPHHRSHQLYCSYGSMIKFSN